MMLNKEQLDFGFEEAVVEQRNKIMLNSILIEGELNGDPIMNNGECIFNINYRRYDRIDIFRIRVKNRLAQVCNDYLKAGRGVRVVGKIYRDEDDEVGIEGEHVEFKPMVRNTND
jgi:hypothetical protein